MSTRLDEPEAVSDGRPPTGAVPEDLSGRSRLLRNLFSSWLSQLVFMALGFVMPRLIDHQVGQVALGVWDFCWSLVNYLPVSGLYVGTSVNRYVARLRGEANARRLNEVIASVVCLQIAAGLIVALGTLLLVLALPGLFAARLGDAVGPAQWVVAFLGAGLAVQMFTDSSRGIITGCHRWDIHNALNVGSQFVASIGMIAALVTGFGLEGMAVVYFAVICVTECLRVRISRRVCPEVKLRVRLASFPVMREMLQFGVKSIVIHTPNLLAIQAASVAVLTVLGPAALAVFARPLALIRHTGTFVDKFAAILTPTASFLQGTASSEELREFFLQSTRFSVALTLPILAVLAVDGDWVMRLWMGAPYVDHALIMALALLHFPIVSQSSVTHVMIGLNAHGRIGGFALLVTVAGVAAAIAAFSLFEWTLASAAVLFVAPLAISKGMVTPWMSCRRLRVSIVEYLRFCFAIPVAVNVVFAFLLWLGRQAPDDLELIGLVTSAVIGGLCTGALYWRHLLTAESRDRLVARFRSRKQRTAGG